MNTQTQTAINDAIASIQNELNTVTMQYSTATIINSNLSFISSLINDLQGIQTIESTDNTTETIEEPTEALNELTEDEYKCEPAKPLVIDGIERYGLLSVIKTIIKDGVYIPNFEKKIYSFKWQELENYRTSSFMELIYISGDYFNVRGCATKVTQEILNSDYVHIAYSHDLETIAADNVDYSSYENWLESYDMVQNERKTEYVGFYTSNDKVASDDLKTFTWFKINKSTTNRLIDFETTKAKLSKSKVLETA